MFVQSALHQLKVAIDTSIQMLNQYTENDLKIKPIESKRSLFEMCTHLALICHADLLILNGITEKELHTFYIEYTPETIAHMQETMLQGYDLLSKTFSSYSNEELAEIKTAYWGIFILDSNGYLKWLHTFIIIADKFKFYYVSMLKILAFLYLNKKSGNKTNKEYYS